MNKNVDIWYTFRARNGEICLSKCFRDTVNIIAIVDLEKLHRIFRSQREYVFIKRDNDEYEKGTKTGGIVFQMPTISLNDGNIFWPKIPLIPLKYRFRIGFVEGSHRTDYLWRRGVKLLPVHATTQDSKNKIEKYIGASKNLIDKELLDWSGKVP